MPLFLPAPCGAQEPTILAVLHRVGDHRGVRRVLAVVIPIVLGGCLPPRAAEVRIVVPAPVRSSLETLEVARPVDGAIADSDPRDAPLLTGLRSAVVQSGAKSVGATSVVFKVPLDGGIAAAFKPETRKHGSRWRSEVAAYRVSRALGLDNVPVTVPRAAKMSALFASTRSSAMARLLREQCLPREDGKLPGAMIAWIPGLSRLQLEDDPLWSAWGEWLSVNPPERSIEVRVGAQAGKKMREARVLAPQLSSLIAFDHVTGNRDRWSGHNILVDVTHTRLVYLDHNLAFDDKLDIASTRKRTMVLHRVERFSRVLVANLRSLTRAALVDALGTDDLGAPLLRDAQVDATLARRDELVTYVDELIAKHGEARVLSFD
jgi:hypothetical protein